MRLPRPLSALALMIILGAWSVHGGGLLDACSTNANCGVGLYCSSCATANATASRCVSEKATPLTNIDSLPYNKVSWLVTHNSYAIVSSPEITGTRITFANQEDNITSQLQNGVRGLMLDTYDFLDDIWLCHSFGGVCYNYTAFEPLSNTLNEVQAFLAANPSEIVTIILEDYVKTPNGLTNVFKAASLEQYWFPVASMPTNGAAWPTVGTMIKNNWRLLVFTSIQSKQASEGIAYQWGFMNENQYGDSGMVPGTCANRAESNPMNSTGASLILQNYFRTDPVEADSCLDNSGGLFEQLPVCYAASGNRWANYLAVDFYKQSTGGGSFQALNKLNGQVECGCNSPLSCQSQKTPGQCDDDPTLAEYSPTFVPIALPSPQVAAVSPPPPPPTGHTNRGRITSNPSNTLAAAAHQSALPARSSRALLVALCLLSWAIQFP